MMQELGVTPDVDTIISYVLPVFPDFSAAKQVFEVGVCVLCGVCVCSWNHH